MLIELLGFGFDFMLLNLSPIEQAEEQVISVGLSARMSERIGFLIREFRIRAGRP